MGMEPLLLHELAEFFPGYELEGFLACDSTRMVVRAQQDTLDRTVAIKLIPRDEVDEEFVSRVKAFAKLSHPNLIGIYDSGEVGGYFFLVMEYVDGGTLAESAGRDQVAVEVAIDLLGKICAGVSRAHESKMIHGRLTPDEILLDSNLNPKIGPGGAHDSHHYWPPETELSERSDVYSLGRILYRLLTSGDPVDLDSPSASEIAETPPALDKLIQRAGNPQPEVRHATIDEFSRNLTQVTKKAPAPTLQRPNVPTSAAHVPVAGTVSAAPAKPAFKLPIAELVKLGCVVLVGFVAFKVVPPLLEDSEPEPTSSNSSSVNGQSSLDVEERTPRKKEVVRIAESGSVALARLRNVLAKGQRTEFPPGTVKGRDSHYYFVEDKLSWPEARAFAEAHGAHLAVFPSVEQREWIRRQLTSRQIAWLGGGQVHRDRWQWIDGEVLGEDEVNPRTLADRYLALNKQGELVPANQTQTYCFIMQWQNDGSNPGTFEEELARVKATNGKSFPLGTRSFGASRYFHLDQSVSWDEARKLATSYGAVLAVPSSVEEHQWICDSYRDFLESGEAIWLGGFRKTVEQPWQWLSKEPWNNVGWSSIPESETEADRVALAGSENLETIFWEMRAGNPSATVLLEWGKPASQAAPIEKQPELSVWLKTVNRRIVQMVEPDLKEFAKQKEKLIQDYGRTMRRLARRAKDSPPRGGRRFFFRAEWAEAMDELDESVREAVKEERLLANLPTLTPTSVREAHEEHVTMLDTIEGTYHIKLMQHLGFYREGLGKRVSQLAEMGFLEDTVRLEGLVPGNLESFLEALFPEDSPYRTLPWESREEEPIEEEEDPPE